MGIRKTKITFLTLSTTWSGVPERRKRILGDEVSQHWRDLFLRVAEEYEFWIYATQYQTYGEKAFQLHMLEELSDAPHRAEG